MLNQETKRKNIACTFLCIVAVAIVAYRLYQRELAVGAAVLIIYGVCMCFFSLHLQRLVAEGKADPKRLREEKMEQILQEMEKLLRQALALGVGRERMENWLHSLLEKEEGGNKA